MGIMIEDGTGSGKTVKIDENNRLLTYAVTRTDPLYFNDEEQTVYKAVIFVTPHSVNPSIEANTYFFYVKNTSEKHLHINRFRHWSESNEIIDIYINVSGSPAGGTEIVPVNSNLGSGNQADGIFLKGSGITGLSGGTLIGRSRIPSSHDIQVIDYESTLILKKNNTVVLSTPIGGSDLEIVMSFYYHI